MRATMGFRERDDFDLDEETGMLHAQVDLRGDEDEDPLRHEGGLQSKDLKDLNLYNELTQLDPESQKQLEADLRSSLARKQR